MYGNFLILTYPELLIQLNYFVGRLKKSAEKVKRGNQPGDLTKEDKVEETRVKILCGSYWLEF
jgi:hypothetical protein